MQIPYVVGYQLMPISGGVSTKRLKLFILKSKEVLPLIKFPFFSKAILQCLQSQSIEGIPSAAPVPKKIISIKLPSLSYKKIIFPLSYINFSLISYIVLLGYIMPFPLIPRQQLRLQSNGQPLMALAAGNEYMLCQLSLLPVSS